MKKIILYSFFIAMVTSCVPAKKLIYLQPEEQESSDKVFTYDRQEYLLQVNDILDVQIKSMNPDVNAIFSNQSSGQSPQVVAQSGGDLYYMSGYSVDHQGEISIPFVGEISVVGLSLAQAEKQIDSSVALLFSNYALQVKLGGIRFSALGEFNAPGKRVVLQNQATIFEAIALSGDLTQLARRDQVKLIRQYPQGTKIHSLNLLDQSIIGSPFYFIQPNDVLYAEPLPQKSYGLGVNGAQTISTLVGVLGSTLAITLSVLSLRP
jgi:polysaccharide export outer membrane protein